MVFTCFDYLPFLAIIFTLYLGMGRYPTRRRDLLAISIAGNLGMLGFFKYFNFFAANVAALAGAVGLPFDAVTLRITLRGNLLLHFPIP